MFDMVCGSDHVRSSIMNHFDFSRLLDFWNGETDRFRERSADYYLYK